MLESIKNFLLTLSAIAAVTSIYINRCNIFFIESVKARYKNNPYNYSIFDVVTKFINYLFVSVSVSVSVIYILQYMWNIVKYIRDRFKGEVVTSSDTDFLSFNFIIGFVFFIIILISIVYVLRNIMELFDKCKNEYINKIENKEYKIINSEELKRNKNARVITIVIIAIWIMFTVTTLYTGIEPVKSNGILVFENNISKRDMVASISFSFFTFISIACYFVLDSLKRISIAINEDVVYTLVIEKESMVCKLYLEINDYYLIFDNGIEKYIRKSDIKKIVKYKKLEGF
ncbi:hypothetical protein H7E67_01245 [Clostridium gasigenes]|uniref:hypothetical protein n=1 Tax=Clostridium gasigenes TaxID=94869 RepID=UPI001625E756|nr:hypothetical protein [Clostridium gasigenes]MBB6622045.1 hypothetical protein [Clostridium gasigenes]